MNLLVSKEQKVELECLGWVYVNPLLCTDQHLAPQTDADIYTPNSCVSS